MNDEYRKSEFKRVQRACEIFNIWTRHLRTYVSPEDAEKAHTTALKYLNREKARLSGAKVREYSQSETNKVEPNYKEMWLELRTEIQGNKDFYDKGVMCSMAESIHGSANAEETLKAMDKIEEKHNNKNNA